LISKIKKSIECVNNSKLVTKTQMKLLEDTKNKAFSDINRKINSRNIEMNQISLSISNKKLYVEHNDQKKLDNS
ncbi:MAG: hypothetical protein MHPSP_001743, partial [Paramarteilia canceri]